MLQRSTGQSPVHAQRKIQGSSRNEHLYIIIHLFQTHIASTDFSLADETGPSKSSSAILVVGDIFGTGSQVMQVQLDSLRFISKQTLSRPQRANLFPLQGADILAYGSEENHQYQVFVPDFMRGNYADHSWFPPDTPEKGQAMGAFFQGPANPATALGAIPGILKEIEEKSGGTITKWAALGLCWGGKVSAFFSTFKDPYCSPRHIGSLADCIGCDSQLWSRYTFRRCGFRPPGNGRS